MNSHVQLFSRHFVREPQVDGFFDAYSCSVQYVISDPSTGRCAAIDPVLDYDEKSGATATSSADALLAFGDSTRLSTARVRVWAGGSASRIRLGGRHGFSLAKSLNPTPQLEQNVWGSLSTARTSA